MAFDYAARLAHVGTRMKELNQQTITYSRGATSVSGIVASPIHMTGDELMPSIAITVIEYQDWAIDVADLGALFPPQVGDKITKATGEEFRVSSLGQDGPPFQYTTSTRVRVLIHSEMIKRA